MCKERAIFIYNMKEKEKNLFYKEEIRDLFSVLDDYFLAQGISADFGMGKGIAVEFNKRFDTKNQILALYPQGFRDVSGCYKPVGCVLVGRVLNLITKQRYFGKPTYDTMRGALTCMKEFGSSTTLQRSLCRLLAVDWITWNGVRYL